MVPRQTVSCRAAATPPRNNDDPNYAEELRQNAALVENTQKMAATLGKDISGINSQLAENQRKYESEMNKLNTQLANMQTALEQAKQGNTEAVSVRGAKTGGSTEQGLSGEHCQPEPGNSEPATAKRRKPA